MNEKDDVADAEEILRQALRIQPSPALLDRVRGDASRPRPAPRALWMASVAAVVALAIVVARRPPVAETAPPRLRALPLPGAGLEQSQRAPNVAAAGAVLPKPEPNLLSPSPERERVPKPSLPSTEILVEPAPAQALARFQELARAGLVNMPTGLLGTDLAAALPAVEPLGMAPLAIEPLDPPTFPEISPLTRGDS